MKKLVVLEPLSVPNDVLEAMLQEKLGGQVEWTLYDQRATSDEEMIEIVSSLIEKLQKIEDKYY